MIPDLDITDIILREDNPYAKGTIIDFGDGEFLLEREPLPSQRSINDRYYTMIQDENIHNIAFQAWNNSKFYWAISDMNDLEFPFDVPAGTSLIIPDLEMVKLNSYAQ